MKRLSGIFASDPELTTTADHPGWRNSGFPPGFTVDELRKYRRKRAPGDVQPKDHLTLEAGDFKHVKSEYRRRFRDYYDANTRNALLYDLKDLSPTRSNKPDDHLTFADDDEDDVEGDNEVDVDAENVHVFRPTHHESFIEFPIEPVNFRRYKRHLDMAMPPIDVSSRSTENCQSENRAQYIQYGQVDRTLPMRRSTSLKLEGDFHSTTEKAEQFIKYLISRRRSLIRNPSQIKLEGTMDNKKTENREQYIPYDLPPRPPLYKKLTNLRLEGDMDITTENSDQFIPYGYEERPPLIKRETNLHLEGDLTMSPEYRHEYKGLTSERSSPSFPRHNLRVDGFFDALTENQSSFVGHQLHPQIPFLRGSDFNRKLLLGDDKPTRFPEYKEKFGPHALGVERVPAGVYKRGEQLSLEGEFDGMTENRFAYVEQGPVRTEMRRAPENLHLEGQMDMSPEYKNAYVDFYKTSNFSSPVRRRQVEGGTLRGEGAMEGRPEYSRSYVDFPRRRPSLVKKPETHLSSEGEMDHMTEKRAQYIEYPGYHKADAMKREPEFKLEGNFECQPEYRKAYINYLIRERVDHKHRPLDNLTGVAIPPPKRAFEVLTAAGATPTTDATSTTTSSVESKAKSQIPVASKNSKTEPSLTSADDTDNKTSAYSSSTNSKIPRRQISINTLETQLFGPKIEMPGTKKRRSRSTSLSRSSRTKGSSSDKEQMHRDRTGSRFSNAVRVEDLAYTPATSPIPTHKLYSYSPHSPKKNLEKRNKTARGKEVISIGDQIDRMTAFMVIDDHDDINNNSMDMQDRNQTFYKEQKWMSSWNMPTA